MLELDASNSMLKQKQARRTGKQSETPCNTDTKLASAQLNDEKLELKKGGAVLSFECGLGIIK